MSFLVKNFDKKELIDVFECRGVLEGLAALKLAQSGEIVKQLSTFFEYFLDIVKIDEVQYGKADQEFHNAIRQLINNVVLKKLDTLGNYLKMTFSLGLVRQPSDTLKGYYKCQKGRRHLNILCVNMLEIQ